jgi:hypothetical protein
MRQLCVPNGRLRESVNLEPRAVMNFFISFSKSIARILAVPRTFRQLKRTFRALHLESWVLAALVVFVSSEFVLRLPGMVAGPSLQSQHHQASSTPKVQSSNDHKPVSHEHSSCQLCMAPSLALAVSSLSQLGKTRLELIEVLPVFTDQQGKSEHRIGLRSRAPPVSLPVLLA